MSLLELLITNSFMTALSFNRFDCPNPIGGQTSNDKIARWLSNLHPMMFALMFSTMYRTSSSLTYGPAGRHMPTLKSFSDTPFT